MSTGDIVAIISLSISLAAIIFVIGKNTQRLEVMEKDLNSLGKKVDRALEDFDKRLDKQANFITRTDQRIVYIEEKTFGDDTAARIRR